MKRKYQLIGSFVIGAYTSETSSVYLKLGAGYTAFDLEENSFPLTQVDRTKVVSFMPAIGVHTDLSENAAVRLELTSEFFGKEYKQVFDVNDEDNPNITRFELKSKGKFSNAAVKMSFLWKV